MKKAAWKVTVTILLWPDLRVVFRDNRLRLHSRTKALGVQGFLGGAICGPLWGTGHWTATARGPEGRAVFLGRADQEVDAIPSDYSIALDPVPSALVQFPP